MRSIEKVCVFCASSSKVDARYLEDADMLGRLLARNRIHVISGGGSSGLMGRLADSVLAEGGSITGIIPGFMKKMDWAHNGLTELIEVNDMHERKRLMIKDVDAIVALPGGVGTLEELTEVITLKQLGQLLVPIIIINTAGYYNHLIDFFEQMIRGNFMRHKHKDIWKVVNRPEDVISAIKHSVPWDKSSINQASFED